MSRKTTSAESNSPQCTQSDKGNLIQMCEPAHIHDVEDETKKDVRLTLQLPRRLCSVPLYGLVLDGLRHSILSVHIRYTAARLYICEMV